MSIGWLNIVQIRGDRAEPSPPPRAIEGPPGESSMSCCQAETSRLNVGITPASARRSDSVWARYPRAHAWCRDECGDIAAGDRGSASAMLGSLSRPGHRHGFRLFTVEAPPQGGRPAGRAEVGASAGGRERNTAGASGVDSGEPWSGQQDALEPWHVVMAYCTNRMTDQHREDDRAPAQSCPAVPAGHEGEISPPRARIRAGPAASPPGWAP